MKDNFKPRKYSKKLQKIFTEIKGTKKWRSNSLHTILKSNLKEKGVFFSKDELVAGYKYFMDNGLLVKSDLLERRIRRKPVRTLSGVAVVTVLTKPYECPGKCIYCPSEDNLPKSYVSKEPGAQRALENKFDPYLQVYNRLLALKNIGHSTDKVELIILGGTWDFYPEDYKVWFVTECFRALNRACPRPAKGWFAAGERGQAPSWESLFRLQKHNETAKCRCVGLCVETRPDYITEEEIIKYRKLGVTKVQIGVQSLDDEILKLNDRGHDVERTKKAFKLLRQTGFKIHAHWMANLHGSTVKKDIKDYKRLWGRDFRPDELKIYPTSIMRGTKLFNLYKSGKYKPYVGDELKELLEDLMKLTPRYCRLTRVIRDIPGEYIVEGNKVTNLRQYVEDELIKQGTPCKCIRCREIKAKKVKWSNLKVEKIEYETSVGKEMFLSYVTKDDKLAGFLRLSLPKEKCFIDELGINALIREVHVYGEVADVGKKEKGKAQHIGIGSKLVKLAEEISKEDCYNGISVISAVGTRKYYERLGYEMGELYMKKGL